ncbi:MAG: YdcF family protein, partial [Parcubacteria group bacterium]|nr:YdcF family protein [Parcubacteria group bacterium]
MEYEAVVAMFCGPHDEGDDAPTRRIDRAIELALHLGLPLMIAGDGNGGLDVAQFNDLAVASGVFYVIALYDSGASTLSDAMCVAQNIGRDPRLDCVSTIHLVTDDWHMDRSKAMLEGELSDASWKRQNPPEVTPSCVTTGPQPARWVIDGERKGLKDYRSGRYGTGKAYAPWGKP